AVGVSPSINRSTARRRSHSARSPMPLLYREEKGHGYFYIMEPASCSERCRGISPWERCRGTHQITDSVLFHEHFLSVAALPRPEHRGHAGGDRRTSWHAGRPG